MTKEDEFLAFAVEYYRQQKGLTGQEVADLFTAYGIFDLIRGNYFLYHIESPQNFVKEIDDTIARYDASKKRTTQENESE